MVENNDRECMLIPKEERRKRIHDYHELMQYKVKDILLVSSLYDACMLEEDGGLAEQIYGQFSDLELSSPPRIMRVSTGAEALVEINNKHYDMVITMTRMSDAEQHAFSIKVKEIDPNIPIVLLVTDSTELREMNRFIKGSGIDMTFFWTGDAKLLVAIINISLCIS